ncbi:hypothetical protein [Streptomyces sp. NPDC054962]
MADSPIVLDGRQGFSVITDLRVNQILPELKAEVARHETHAAGHKEALRNLVSAQRETRNTATGYWVAAAGSEAAEHALTGTVHASDVRAAALLSDGAACLVTDYAMSTWPEVFATLRAGGPRELIDTVRKVEATDPRGQRWPRYKSGDDASVAFCQWG